MTQERKPKLKPDAAYEHAHLVAQDLLSRISELLTDMPNPEFDGVNWGHVGDLTYVNSQLTELVRFLGGDK